MRWVRSWKVPSSSNPAKEYTVSQDAQGEFGCSCLAWTRQRRHCKHIQAIERLLAGPTPVTVTPTPVVAPPPAPISDDSSPALREGRQRLPAFQPNGPRPEDLQGLVLLGDEIGLAGLQAEFRQGAVLIRYAHALWHVDDVAHVQPVIAPDLPIRTLDQRLGAWAAAIAGALDAC